MGKPGPGNLETRHNVEITVEIDGKPKEKFELQDTKITVTQFKQEIKKQFCEFKTIIIEVFYFIYFIALKLKYYLHFPQLK